MIKVLFSKYLNYNYKFKNKFNIKIIEKPGLWYSDLELKQLVDDLRSIAVECSDGNLDYGALKGDRKILSKNIITIIYEVKTNKPVAFNALTLIPINLSGRKDELLHLGLVNVRPEFRSAGLTWALYGLTVSVILARRQFKDLWISNVTQVPSIIGQVAQSFYDVYPAPENITDASYHHRTLAHQIMKNYRWVFGVGEDATFNYKKFIIENSYTGGSDNLKKTFEQTQKHRKSPYNDLCEKHLDYERGDDFLQIGKFTLRSFTDYALKTIPKEAKTKVIASQLVAMAQSYLIPILLWLDDKNNYKGLQAWKK